MLLLLAWISRTITLLNFTPAFSRKNGLCFCFLNNWLDDPDLLLVALPIFVLRSLCAFITASSAC